MPDPHEAAKVYFSAARAEILQRLALREQVLLAGVATFGVVGGVALTANAPFLLHIFPLLSIAFTLVLFRHHWLITDLSNYVNFELSPSLGIEKKGTLPEADPMPLHWDAWLQSSSGRHFQAPKRTLRNILSFELSVSWLLLWGPGLAGLILFLVRRYQATGTINWCDPFLWVDAVLLALAIVPFVQQAWQLTFKWR